MRHPAIPQVEEYAGGCREDFPQHCVVEITTTSREITQTGGIDQLQCVKIYSELLITFINQRNRRMIHRRARTGFVHKTLHPVDVLAVLAIQGFQCHMPADRGLFSLVQRKVGIPLDLAQQLVVTQPRPHRQSLFWQFDGGRFVHRTRFSRNLLARFGQDLRGRRTHGNTMCREIISRPYFALLDSTFRIFDFRLFAGDLIEPFEENPAIHGFEKETLLLDDTPIVRSHVLVTAEDTREKSNFPMEMISQVERFFSRFPLQIRHEHGEVPQPARGFPRLRGTRCFDHPIHSGLQNRTNRGTILCRFIDY